MNSNLAQLVKACDLLGVTWNIRHPSGNLVEVSFQERSYFFAAWTTPLNDHALVHISLDKDFFYQLSHRLVPTPQTVGYFAPHSPAQYQKYIQFTSEAAVATDILERFRLPLIIKRNRGSGGRHVFLCQNAEQVTAALGHIFQRDSVALAQEYLEIQSEYRVIFLDGMLQLAYEKSVEGATFTGNLSRLHWSGAKAKLVEDPVLLGQFQEQFAPLFQGVPLRFCGLDIAATTDGKLWLIESNSAPGFARGIAGCGPEPFIRLYQAMLCSLFQIE